MKKLMAVALLELSFGAGAKTLKGIRNINPVKEFISHNKLNLLIF